MRLYYYRRNNFGDALNAWLWPRLLPGILDEDGRAIFVGIGTLLNNRIPKEPVKVVFGSGVGYGKGVPVVDEKWQIYCVRGPLSAQALGIDPALAVTDSAALLRVLDIPSQPKQYPVSFVPHWYSADYWDWRGLCAEVGVSFIDPMAPIEVVLDEIQRSEMVVAEAMHAAIIADALRIPWVPVRAYSHILSFKWQDWTSSLGLEYAPIPLPALRSGGYITAKPRRALRRLHWEDSLIPRLMLQSVEQSVGRVYARLSTREVAAAAQSLKLASAAEPVLSSDQAILSATACLKERLERFRSDYAAGRFSVP